MILRERPGGVKESGRAARALYLVNCWCVPVATSTGRLAVDRDVKTVICSEASLDPTDDVLTCIPGLPCHTAVAGIVYKLGSATCREK